MRFFELGFSPFAYFFLGFGYALAMLGLWHLFRFLVDIRITRARARRIEKSGPRDELAALAWKRVAECRRRLRLNPNPNPEWLSPLIVEVPKLVGDIAVIYYPDHPEPIQAPRISEFARAVQFVAMDIAQLLQSRRVGRLIDVSAGRTVQAWRTGHRVWNDTKVRKARSFLEPLFKVGKPIWQVARLKSPLTWISLAASNAAIRTIHPAVINIIAHRAIDLYGGRIEDAQPRESLDPDELTPEAARPSEGGESAGGEKPSKRFRLRRPGR